MEKDLLRPILKRLRWHEMAQEEIAPDARIMRERVRPRTVVPGSSSVRGNSISRRARTATTNCERDTFHSCSSCRLLMSVVAEVRSQGWLLQESTPASSNTVLADIPNNLMAYSRARINVTTTSAAAAAATAGTYNVLYTCQKYVCTALSPATTRCALMRFSSLLQSCRESWQYTTSRETTSRENSKRKRKRDEGELDLGEARRGCTLCERCAVFQAQCQRPRYACTILAPIVSCLRGITMKDTYMFEDIAQDEAKWLASCYNFAETDIMEAMR